MPYASDALWAHSSTHLHGKIALPKNIAHENAIGRGDQGSIKTTAAKLVDSGQFPKDCRGNTIIKLNKSNPTDPANAALYSLIISNANGEVTASLLKDFNALHDTNYFISEAKINITENKTNSSSQTDVSFTITDANAKKSNSLFGFFWKTLNLEIQTVAFFIFVMRLLFCVCFACLKSST